MKSTSKIYAFFIVVALLFWNPVTFNFVYRNTGVFTVTPVRYFFWFAPLAGICVAFAILRNLTGTRFNNFVLSIVFAGIMLSILVLFDGLLGVVSNSQKPTATQALVFEPGSNAHYKTTEFDVMAKINSLGLRNPEIALDHPNIFRILCFGDSFTFGWGVDEEDGWPRKLEHHLRTKGYTNIEVINCGQGGQFTSSYKKYIQKAVPALKPDLVLVGVLQLDDLAQLYENNYLTGREGTTGGSFLPTVLSKIGYSATTFLASSFKNILSLINGKHGNDLDVHATWESSANSILNNFSRLQQLRFNALPDSVRILFKGGNLNPGLVEYYINFPERNFIFNDPKHESTRFAISEMVKDLEQIKSICEQNSCRLGFINIPLNCFTGHRVVRTQLDLLDKVLYEHNKIDSIYRAIAEGTNIPYIELTDKFKSLEDKNAYFYRYDGHPNKRGYDQIAQGISETLINKTTLLKNSKMN